MANMTDAFENTLLDAIAGVTTNLSTTMALALFTADPTDTGSVVNELSGDGYARKLLSGTFSSATGTTGTTTNTGVIDNINTQRDNQFNILIQCIIG